MQFGIAARQPGDVGIGGGGFVAIVSDDLFAGTVELETPLGKARIDPGPPPAVTTSETAPGATAERLVSAAAAGLRRYYERRHRFA